MTNYNERLDEILQGELVCISYDPEAYVAGIEDTKQAITSLIKELVVEAKPGYKPISKYAASIYNQGFNQAVDEFEQNLLKGLEENESWYALGRMIDPREFVAEIGGLELKLQEEAK